MTTTNKWCSSCKDWLPLECFNRSKANCDGLQYTCRYCHKERYQRDRAERLKKSVAYNVERRKQMREYVASRKASPCTDCGNSYPPVAMDFDHVRGDKRLDVSQMVGRAMSKRLIDEEIEKCDLVCAVCHRLRTAARLNLE